MRLIVVCATHIQLTAVCTCNASRPAGAAIRECRAFTCTQLLIANPAHEACAHLRDYPQGGLNPAQRANIDEANDIMGYDNLSQVSAAGVEALVNLPDYEPRLHNADARLGDRALRRVRGQLL